MQRIAFNEAASLPELRHTLIAIRRDPAGWRRAHGTTARALCANGRITELTVGPRGGVTRRTVGVIGSRATATAASRPEPKPALNGPDQRR